MISPVFHQCEKPLYRDRMSPQANSHTLMPCTVADGTPEVGFYSVDVDSQPVRKCLHRIPPPMSPDATNITFTRRSPRRLGSVPYVAQAIRSDAPFLHAFLSPQMPTFILFKEGKVVQQFSGANPPKLQVCSLFLPSTGSQFSS